VEIARQQAIRRAKDRVLDLVEVVVEPKAESELKEMGVVGSENVGKKQSVASAGQGISQVEIDNILLIT
jgi:hypothetical protein